LDQLVEENVRKFPANSGTIWKNLGSTEVAVGCSSGGGWLEKILRKMMKKMFSFDLPITNADLVGF